MFLLSHASTGQMSRRGTGYLGICYGSKHVITYSWCSCNFAAVSSQSRAVLGEAVCTNSPVHLNEAIWYFQPPPNKCRRKNGYTGIIMLEAYGREWEHLRSIAWMLRSPSQDLKNWEPKIGNFKISGHSIFQGRSQYTQSGDRLFGYRLG